jgi:hypothetical protein
MYLMVVCIPTSSFATSHARCALLTAMSLLKSGNVSVESDAVVIVTGRAIADACPGSKKTARSSQLVTNRNREFLETITTITSGIIEPEPSPRMNRWINSQ